MEKSELNDAKEVKVSLAALSLAAQIQDEQKEDIFSDEPILDELSAADANPITDIEANSTKDGITEIDASQDAKADTDIGAVHETGTDIVGEYEAVGILGVDEIEQHQVTDEFNNLSGDDLDDNCDLDIALQQSASLIDFLMPTTELPEEDLDASSDETIVKTSSPKSKINSEQNYTQQSIEPQLNVMHDLDAELTSESAKEQNIDTDLNQSATQDENLKGFEKDSLTIEQDNPKIPPDLLTRKYKMDVVYTFGLPTLEGISLKHFQINSPEQCVDIQLKNGVIIKDYGKGFSLNGDDETCLGLAAIKMAKMKGWKCIKASGDPAYLTELENQCKKHGLGLRRSDVDYGRILRRVDNAIKTQNQSMPRPSQPQTSELKAAPKANAETPKASTTTKAEPEELVFPSHHF